MNIGEKTPSQLHTAEPLARVTQKEFLKKIIIFLKSVLLEQ